MTHIVKIETSTGKQTTGFATEIQARRAVQYAMAHGALSAVVEVR